MYPNEGDLWEICKLPLQLLKLCQHMNAINAAASPEINDNEFVLQLAIHGQWLVIERVKPFQTVIGADGLLQRIFA